jgi:hypothetical protein
VILRNRQLKSLRKNSPPIQFIKQNSFNIVVVSLQNMKKLIALLLLSVFVSSSAVKLYKDFTDKDVVSISLQETEDDNTEKELEKENDLKKDKLILSIISFSLPNLSETQKYYIKHLYFLPKPLMAKDIIPPNAA